MNRAIAIIREFEGLRRTPYLCPSGYATIGFGHILRDEHRAPLYGQTGLMAAIRRYPKGISVAQAEAWLLEDAGAAAVSVDRHVRVTLTPGQREALISFTFNLGAGNLASSTLLKKLNAGDYLSIPAELARWTRGGPPGRKKVLNGLVRRREAEASLWRATG